MQARRAAKTQDGRLDFKLRLQIHPIDGERPHSQNLHGDVQIPALSTLLQSGAWNDHRTLQVNPSGQVDHQMAAYVHPRPTAGIAPRLLTPATRAGGLHDKRKAHPCTTAVVPLLHVQDHLGLKVQIAVSGGHRCNRRSRLGCIVVAALFHAAKDIVRRLNSFELSFRAQLCLTAGMTVGVVFHGELAVRTFDVLGRSVAQDPQCSVMAHGVQIVARSVCRRIPFFAAGTRKSGCFATRCMVA